jgi:hypothetical protein
MIVGLALQYVGPSTHLTSFDASAKAQFQDGPVSGSLRRTFSEKRLSLPSSARCGRCIGVARPYPLERKGQGLTVATGPHSATIDRHRPVFDKPAAQALARFCFAFTNYNPLRRSGYA